MKSFDKNLYEQMRWNKENNGKRKAISASTQSTDCEHLSMNMTYIFQYHISNCIRYARTAYIVVVS